MPNNEIPQLVKDIYNDHLVYTRNFHRKPFKKRKNFKGFEEDPRYKNYHQLAMWFKIHPEINVQLFFEAYLYFNPTRKAIPIKYYVHPNALTYYTRYIKILDTIDLDDPVILKQSVNSFKFIEKFCKKNNVKLDEYIKYKDDNSVTYSWLKHVKENNVNIYVLFSFTGFFSMLKSIYKDIDLWNFYLSRETPYFFLKRWSNSKEFQSITNKAKTIIQ